MNDESYIILARQDWERIFDLANGAVEWDDASGTVDEADRRARAMRCCEEVVRANDRWMQSVLEGR